MDVPGNLPKIMEESLGTIRDMVTILLNLARAIAIT